MGFQFFAIQQSLNQSFKIVCWNWLRAFQSWVLSKCRVPGGLLKITEKYWSILKWKKFSSNIFLDRAQAHTPIIDFFCLTACVSACLSLIISLYRGFEWYGNILEPIRSKYIARQRTTNDGRWPLMKDDLWWKTPFDGRRPLMEDDVWWKMTFNRRRP